MTGFASIISVLPEKQRIPAGEGGSLAGSLSLLDIAEYAK